MENYTPSKEDILWAKVVNDKLVATQTYVPDEIKEAYRRLFGEEAPNQHFARSKVFRYFQYIFKATDITETAEITTPAIVIDNPSHNENDETSEDEDEVRVISFDNDNQTVTTPDGITHDLSKSILASQPRDTNDYSKGGVNTVMYLTKEESDELKEKLLKPKRGRKPSNKKK